MQTDKCKVLQYTEYERQQAIQETDKLYDFILTNTRESWRAMTKQHNVKGFKAIRDQGVTVWTEGMVGAVYSTCILEAK